MRKLSADERRKKGGTARALCAARISGLCLREQKGKIIGFIAIWEFDDFVYVEHFALTESCRGLGLGSKMLKETAKLLKSRSVLRSSLRQPTSQGEEFALRAQRNVF